MWRLALLRYQAALPAVRRFAGYRRTVTYASEDTETAQVNRLERSINGLGQRIESVPQWLFLVVVTGMLLIRDGVYVFTSEWQGIQTSIDEFPNASGFMSWSWGNVVVGKLLGIDSIGQWTALHVGLTALAIGVPVAFMWKVGRGRFEPFVVYWYLLPVVASVLMWIGMYDVVTLLGAGVVALARRWWSVSLGALVMSSGNPEQAVFIAATLLSTTAGSLLADRRKPALITLAVTAAAAVLSHVIITGEVADRSGLLRPASEGVAYLVREWPTSVWDLNGLIWFVLAAVMLGVGWRDRAALFGALLLLPLLPMFVTYDWARVYWLVTSATLIALGAAMARRLTPGTLSRSALLAGIFALLIIPPFNGGPFFLVTSIGDLLRAVGAL